MPPRHKSEASYRAEYLGLPCKHCGWEKNCALHMPCYGQTEGAYDHKYEPESLPAREKITWKQEVPAK